MIKMVIPGRDPGGGGGPRIVVFWHIIYCTLINISEQLMSQRHQIVLSGVSSIETLIESVVNDGRCHVNRQPFVNNPCIVSS